MHTRRLITFLLGAWFAVVLTVLFVTSAGNQVAGNIAKTPPAEPGRALVLIGEPMTEKLFRYVASEINRTMLESGGWAELVLVSALVGLLFLQNYNRQATIVSAVLFLGVCATKFLLTPQVVGQGRMLDFRALDLLVAERARFSNLQMAYGVLTALKLVCGAWIGVILLYRGPNSRMRRRRSNVDAVDDAENGHVNG
jgi:hypothetical protein